jgi:uncharacterized protein (TIGR00251 family)
MKQAFLKSARAMHAAKARWMLSTSQGVLIRIRVQPQASKTELYGLVVDGDDVRLRIRIAATPVDGAANQELLCYLKKTTKVPMSQITIVKGETSRNKDVLFRSISEKRLIWFCKREFM